MFLSWGLMARLLSISYLFIYFLDNLVNYKSHSSDLASGVIWKGITVIFKISTFTPNAIYTWTGGKNYAQYFKRVKLDTFWLKPCRRQKLQTFNDVQ